MRPVALCLAFGCAMLACAPAPTVLVAHVSAAGMTTVATLEIVVRVADADGGVGATQTTSIAAPTLPATIRVFLGDTSTDVNVDLHAIDNAGRSLDATASAKSRPHQQVDVELVLQPASSGEVQWTLEKSGTTNNLFGVWGVDGDRYAVGANGTLLHASQSSTWSAQSSGTTGTLFGVGGDASHVFVVGVLGCDLLSSADRGVSWSKVDHCSGGGAATPLEAIRVDDRGRVLAVGDSYRCYTPRDVGSGWQEVCGGVGDDFYGIAFLSDQAIVVGGSGASTYSTTLGSFASGADTGTSSTLRSAFTVGASAYAVGAGGTIIRFDGKSWSRIASGVASDLYGGTGSAVGDLYVVGAGGLIRHSSDGGANWATQQSGTSSTLRAIWSTATRDLYAVGDGGVILHGR